MPRRAQRAGVRFARGSPLARALGRVARHVHGDARRVHRQHRPAEHRAGVRGRPGDGRVGRRRLPAGHRQPAPPVRPPGRGGLVPEGLPRRVRDLHGGQRPVRPGPEHRRPHRVPGAPGRRGGDAHGDGPRHRGPHVRPGRTRPGARPQRDQRLDRPDPGARAGRPPDRACDVASDLPGQRAGRARRHRLGCADPAGGPTRPARVVRHPGGGPRLRRPPRPPARPQPGRSVGLDEPGHGGAAPPRRRAGDRLPRGRATHGRADDGSAPLRRSRLLGRAGQRPRRLRGTLHGDVPAPVPPAGGIRVQPPRSGAPDHADPHHRGARRALQRHPVRSDRTAAAGQRRDRAPVGGPAQPRHAASRLRPTRAGVAPRAHRRRTGALHVAQQQRRARRSPPAAARHRVRDGGGDARRGPGARDRGQRGGRGRPAARPPRRARRRRR